MDDENIIYRIDENISFRKCSLFDIKGEKRGDCTNAWVHDENWKQVYECKQSGIHFHCTKHLEQEYEIISEVAYETVIRCPRCQKEIAIGSVYDLTEKCMRMLNSVKFKNAKLIRLDDWYVPEVKKEVEDLKNSEYWIKTDIKTDRDGDTMVILYVGYKGQKDKSQFFIKPEKLQLSSDHKDMDPQKILSKIEVTLRNRKISQEFDS